MKRWKRPLTDEEQNARHDLVAAVTIWTAVITIAFVFG